MKAWLLESIGGLDRLRLDETADPSPAAGEVVLDVELAGLNPADRYLAEGKYPARPSMPHILGRDGLGIVSAVGSGAQQFRVGQRLMILRGGTGVSERGTFAQRVAVSIESVAIPPANWSLEESAGAALVYLTAYQALKLWGDLGPSIVLITGASGGVGVAATQLARAMGHTVVALSRDSAKRKTLHELGATHAIDPSDPQWPDKLKATLAGGRVGLAIDNIGGPLFPQVIETLGDHGKISLVGRLAGPVPQFNTASMFFHRLKMGGVAVGAYTPRESQEAWAQSLKLLDRIGARPLVDRVFPFDQLPAAFAHLAAGPMGKVLLKVKSAD
jgi:NADPH2:quinone reductase